MSLAASFKQVLQLQRFGKAIPASMPKPIWLDSVICPYSDLESQSMFEGEQPCLLQNVIQSFCALWSEQGNGSSPLGNMMASEACDAGANLASEPFVLRCNVTLH